MKKMPFIYFLFLSFHLVSQSHDWQRTNPGGGGAFSTIGAGATGIVIAGSDLSGAYRSIDQGQHWDAIGSFRGLTDTHVSGVGFHPTNGDILYIGTDNGIFRSDNGGETVSRVLDGGYITDIEIARSNSSIGYAAYHPMYNAREGVIYKTIDRGETWQKISTNLASDLRILKIIIDPNDENILWLLSGKGRFACGPAQIWRSTNGGKSWARIAKNLGEILDINIDQEESPSLYLTTMNTDCGRDDYWTELDGSLYQSTNSGNNWTKVMDLSGVIWIDWEHPETIRLIDPRNPYVWNELAGTWQTNDGGTSWTHISTVSEWDYFFNNNLPTGNVFSYSSSFNGISKTLGEDLSNPNNLYWTNSQWVFGTFDGGVTFDNLHTTEITNNWWQSTGFDNIVMMDLAISDANPDLIYIGLWDMGLWRSIDNGISWQSCNATAFTGTWDGFGGNTATVLADPDRANVVWASLSGDMVGDEPVFLIRSNTAGDIDNWVLSNVGLPNKDIIGLSIDRNSSQDKRTLYVTAEGNVYKSSDDGYHWNRILNKGGCHFTAVDYFDGNIVYAGGEGGLWRSVNGGENWNNIGVADMNGNPNIGFWDWGWTGISETKTSPHQKGALYVSSFGNDKGLWYSADMGDTWEKLITDDFMRSVAISPRNANILYAGSSSTFEAGGYDENSNGIYFSDDAGKTWIQENNNLSWPFVLTVEVSTSNWAYIGSPGTGFHKSKVPNTTAISDKKRSNPLQIYPSPGYSNLTIAGDYQNVIIHINDLSGKLIFEKKNVNNMTPIDISKLATGMYFISVKDNNNEIQVHKWVKGF